MEFIGTRTGFGTTVAGTIEAMLETGDVAGVAIASAYWDAAAVPFASALADHAGAPVQLLLWTAGATKASWRSARDGHAPAHGLLDLRFVDSPEGGGIFHAKVAGTLGRDGSWQRALVGSCNLTEAGLARNVELGVLVRANEAPLHELQGWFDTAFAAAQPAHAIDWGRAIEIAAERSEAAKRNADFRAAALAGPIPAPAFERPWVPSR